MSSASFRSMNHGLDTPRSAREPIEIALVNNMPDAALQTTEQQFSELLGAAGGGYDIRLRLFSFPELIRSDAGRAYVANHYESIDSLWGGGFDGLIVTGAEPRTPTLPDEVYWPSLTRLVDFANDTATPTVWSCLAAHAAVLYLDGIERRRLPEKISGVFRCDKACDNPLMAGVPASWPMPHSRLNTLDSARLSTAGYEILSFSEDAGVDTFIQHRRAPFVFYQGHPEYDAGALFREYRRDVGRYLAGTMEHYPEMPAGYFDDERAHSFDAFRARAERQRSRDLLEEFPDSSPPHLWHDVAILLYGNWLGALVAERGSDRMLTGSGAASARSP